MLIIWQQRNKVSTPLSNYLKEGLCKLYLQIDLQCIAIAKIALLAKWFKESSNKNYKMPFHHSFFRCKMRIACISNEKPSYYLRSKTEEKPKVGKLAAQC